MLSSRERLPRFVDCVGRDNVMAGSDCSFSQSPLGGRVHFSIMWAKLRCLAEGAAIASKKAWGASEKSLKVVTGKITDLLATV
jgi:5-methyltetrahydropteroyltriglutamate--homocysteine methyltransferase